MKRILIAALLSLAVASPAAALDVDRCYREMRADSVAASMIAIGTLDKASAALKGSNLADSDEKHAASSEALIWALVSATEEATGRKIGNFTMTIAIHHRKLLTRASQAAGIAFRSADEKSRGLIGLSLGFDLGNKYVTAANEIAMAILSPCDREDAEVKAAVAAATAKAAAAEAAAAAAAEAEERRLAEQSRLATEEQMDAIVARLKARGVTELFIDSARRTSLKALEALEREWRTPEEYEPYQGPSPKPKARKAR